MTDRIKQLLIVACVASWSGPVIRVADTCCIDNCQNPTTCWVNAGDPISAQIGYWVPKGVDEWEFVVDDTVVVSRRCDNPTITAEQWWYDLHEVGNIYRDLHVTDLDEFCHDKYVWTGGDGDQSTLWEPCCEYIPEECTDGQDQSRFRFAWSGSVNLAEVGTYTLTCTITEVTDPIPDPPDPCPPVDETGTVTFTVVVIEDRCYENWCQCLHVDPVWGSWCIHLCASGCCDGGTCVDECDTDNCQSCVDDVCMPDCSGACEDPRCSFGCGGGPCSPDCPTAGCNPDCGGDPCSDACSTAGCTDCGSGGGPCDPACPTAPCNPTCDGYQECDPDCAETACDPTCDNYDPCSTACGDPGCKVECGGGPCSPLCGDSDCKPECGGDECDADCDTRACNADCDPDGTQGFGPCHPDCPTGPCNPACLGSDPCSVDCGGQCDPDCGGDPCAPECGGGGPCDEDCGGGPCVAACPTAPCNPACGGGPCNPACPTGPCNLACGGSPCDPDCPTAPCDARCGDPCADPTCCPAGQCLTCSGGACVSACGPGQACCNGACCDGTCCNGECCTGTCCDDDLCCEDGTVCTVGENGRDCCDPAQHETPCEGTCCPACQKCIQIEDPSNPGEFVYVCKDCQELDPPKCCDASTGECDKEPCENLQITEVELPNDFLAVPDPEIYTTTHGTVTQMTENDVVVTYKCEAVNCNCPAGDHYLELWVEQGETSERLDFASIPEPTADPHTETVRFSIPASVQQYSSPVYKLKLASTCGNVAYQVPAHPLIYEIDFSPSAHIPQPDGTFPGPYPVCPYTYRHLPIMPNDPDGEWYGLSLTLRVYADVDPFSIDISGYGMGGTKTLGWPDGIRHVNCNPILPNCRRVKWEGYDWSVTESPLYPVLTFPSATQLAPDHVVREGEYTYRIIGTAETTLYQHHEVTGLKVYVEYELDSVDILCGY